MYRDDKYPCILSVRIRNRCFQIFTLICLIYENSEFISRLVSSTPTQSSLIEVVDDQDVILFCGCQ